MNENPLTIFIDTNILLHYKRLDQIIWRELYQKKDINIAVCAVVFGELEKNKAENKFKKLRKRASEYAGWLLKKYDDPVLNPTAKICFPPNEPMIDFTGNGLDKQNFDDRLIATVLEYKLAYPEIEVSVLTADIGLTFKLKMRQITVSNLPDTYKLPEELDEQELEIRDLRQQLTKFRDRMPKLDLLFNTMKPLDFIKLEELPSKDIYITHSMGKIKSHFPKSSTAQFASITQKISGVAASNYSHYDKKLDEFYIKYEIYSANLYEFYKRKKAIIKLNLTLSNLNGSASARDIDIFIGCEKAFHFLKKETLPDKPEPPKPPKKPTSIFDSYPLIAFPDLPNLPRIKTPSEILAENNSDHSTLTITDKGATYYLAQLKHKQTIELIPIWVDFEDASKIKNLSISYEIHALEIVDPVLRELHLKI